MSLEEHGFVPLAIRAPLLVQQSPAAHPGSSGGSQRRQRCRRDGPDEPEMAQMHSQRVQWLMIEILHDLVCKDPWNYGPMVCMV